MTITVTCNLCGASITSPSVDEAMQWNGRHDALCTTKPVTS